MIEKLKINKNVKDPKKSIFKEDYVWGYISCILGHDTYGAYEKKQMNKEQTSCKEVIKWVNNLNVEHVKCYTDNLKKMYDELIPEIANEFEEDKELVENIVKNLNYEKDLMVENPAWQLFSYKNKYLVQVSVATDDDFTRVIEKV